MKITLSDYLGLCFLDRKVGLSIKRQLNSFHFSHEHNPHLANVDENYLKDRKKFMDELLDDKDNITYFISAKANEIAENVKVGKNFNYKLLNTIRDQKSTYIIDKNSFYRFMIKDGSLFILYVLSDKDFRLHYHSFRVDLKNNIIFNTNEESFMHLEYLIKHIIFINLSDVEFIYLPPNRKIGSRSKNTSIKNATGLPFTIVDSNWNKIVVRTENFSVRGHLRLQPYGRNFSKRKLIWINDHEKKGYVRGLKKIVT